MKKSIGAIKQGIKHEVKFYKVLSKHPQTPLVSKTLIILAIVYLFSPLDLIPDFIPVLGQLDELVLIPLLIYIALRLIPEMVIQETKEKVK